MEFQTSAEKEENNQVQVSSKEMWGGHSYLAFQQSQQNDVNSEIAGKSSNYAI